MKIASFKLPEDLDRSITELARRRHTSRSAVVRDALERLVGEPIQSAADLAGELVGCVEGPDDLSTSKAHMDGFGE